MFVKHYPNAIASAVASSAADAVVATVPAVLGNVSVTSPEDAGPINVTLLLPFPLFSKNSTNPADVEPFFTDIPALAIGFAVSVATPVTNNVPLISASPLTSNSVPALTCVVAAVISNVVPALISKCPSDDAIMFSPPAAS